MSEARNSRENKLTTADQNRNPPEPKQVLGEISDGRRSDPHNRQPERQQTDIHPGGRIDVC